MADGTVAPVPEGTPPFRSLELHDFVLRALTKKKWLETPQGFEEAFIRKLHEDGLSVCFDCHPEQCRDIVDLSPVYGVAELSVRGVTSLTLTLRTDGPNHAEILGVPAIEEDRRHAEWLASKLAEIATIVDRTKRLRPPAP